MQDYHIEHNNLMARIKKPLFNKTLRASGVSVNDVITSIMPNFQGNYAITVNPAPTKLLNKKQYCKYTEDQQRAMLTRMEAALRRTTPSIELIELHFEKCPSNGMIHFHALYQMPEIYVTTMENYYRVRLDSTDKNTKVPWRHLDIQKVYNRLGWITYIQKDSVKSFGTKVVKL